MSAAKEYLERIKWYDVLIDSKLEELNTLNGMVKRITPVMNTTGGGVSGNQDKLGDTIAKIVDLQEEINRDVVMFVDMKREAARLLKKIRRPEYFQVLHKRYILGESLERITIDMGYTHRGMCYLHGRALQVFDKVLEEEKALEEGKTKKTKVKNSKEAASMMTMMAKMAPSADEMVAESLKKRG